jgi:hypothetical protein
MIPTRLVVYGCSITSGFELADTIIFSDLTEKEIDNKKKKIDIIEYINWQKTKTSLDQIKELERNLAWPKYIADDLNIEYINKAFPGGDTDSSIFLLEKDINSKFILKTDIIIIAHTDIRRWFWIDNNGISHNGCLGGTDKRWPTARFHKDFDRYVANKYHLGYHWYKNIKYLDMLSKNLNGMLLQQYCYSKLDQELLMDFQTDFTSLIDNQYSFKNILDLNDYANLHVFGHPKVNYHKTFASHLLNRIREKIL